MHILIIPSEINIIEISQTWSIFQRRQAQILVTAGYNVGMLCTGILPMNQLYKKNKYSKYKTSKEDGVNVARFYKKRILPLKFIPLIFQNIISISIAIRAFEKYVNDFGMPDLIHAHNCFFAGLIAKSLKRKYGVPYMVTEHSSKFNGLLNKNDISLFNQVHKESIYYTAVSDMFAKKLQSLTKAKEKPVHVLNNVLDEIFEYQQVVFKPKEGSTFRFLNVANLIDIKNQKLLIEAFASKFADNKNVLLMIAGDGPNKCYLQKLSDKLGVSDQVKFLGQLERNQVLKEMQQSDAFVLSSNSETFGVVLIEALSCGLPLISTKCGGPDEIVNFKNGLLVEKCNIHSYAIAMESIFQRVNAYDRELIREECLNKYGKAAFIKNISKFYQSSKPDIILK